MNLKVPFFQKPEIERMALDLLQKYEAWKGVKLTPPISIDDIVEGYLRLDFQIDDLKERLSIPDVLGATWFEDKVMRIDSSLEGKEGRLSFTMAHEVGHWWMHRPYYEMEKVTLPLFSFKENVQPTPAIVCRSGRKKDSAEWQADQFAALLLMPKAMLHTLISSLQNGPVLIEDLDKSKANVAENYNLRVFAKQLIQSGFNNVSVDAMCYRLHDLTFVVDSKLHQGSLF
ncbi:MAG: ImmA/IrrE family metallo-endopeptidase [Deltaproteobacteria bacterium]|nr:ImmA/IrrE family metallo-endopeptidase [Deltaproteobacteria bacterium]